MCKFIFNAIIVCLLCANICFAQEITGQGIYVLQNQDTIGAEENAYTNAKAEAMDKTILYIKAYCKSNNYNLSEKEIEKITANVLTVVDKKFIWDNNVVTCNATFNIEDLHKYIKIEKENDDLMYQNDQLRRDNKHSINNAPPNTYITHNTYARHQCSLGDLRIRYNNPGDAIEYYERAIKADNQYIEAWEGYFTSLLMIKLPYTFKTKMNEMLKYNPWYKDTVNYYYFKGWEKVEARLLGGYRDNKYEHSYAIDTNNQEGLDYFQKALDMKCTKNDIYQKIAFLHASKIKRNLEMAKYNLNYARQLGDKAPEWTYFVEGYIDFTCTKYNSAVDKFKSSLQCNEYFIESQKHLCKCYENMLDYKNYFANHTLYVQRIVYMGGGYKINPWN